MIFNIFILISACKEKNVNVNAIDPSSKQIDVIDLINGRIKTYIMANANDPSSYEPISTVLSDSVTYLNNFNDQLKVAEQSLNFDKKMNRLYGESMSTSEKARVKVDQKVVDSLKTLKDSVLNSKNPNSIRYYYFLHDCRLKNGFGGLVKSTYKIETDPFYHIIYMVEKK